MAKSKKKLTERKDAAAKLSLQMVMTMIGKVFEMRKIRAQIMRNRKKELKEIKRKYDSKINLIDKDIYNFENTIKQVTSAQELYALKREYKEKIKQEKFKSKLEKERLKREKNKQKNVGEEVTQNQTETN